MTEFGKARMDVMLRVRLVLLAGACVFALVLLVTFDSYVYLLVAACLAVDFGATFFARPWQRHFGPERTLRIFLTLDLLVIAVVVFCGGGIRGGLAALYVLPPFIALLLLGRQDALRFALLSGSLFLLQVVLDLNGIQVYAGVPSLYVSISGQSVIIVLFLSIVLVLASLMVDMTRQLHQDRNVAEVKRTLAEQGQARWALVNTVALRVQESTTRAQVFATIGDELERRGLHCVVLEWTKPDVSMHVVYASLSNESLHRALGFFQVDLEKFDVLLEQTIGLASAVTQRTPVLLTNSAESMPRIFPKIPPLVMNQLLSQFEMRTMVFAPMLHGDKVNGVLLVFSNALEETDVAPFAALANQAGSALEKARLLSEQRKRTAQLEIVSGLSARVNAAGSLNENLQAIAEQVRQEFGYHIVGIFEIDYDQRRAVLLAASGMLVQQMGSDYAQSLDLGILGLVARSGEVYLARDTREDANYLTLLGQADTVRSELTIPIKQGDTVLGLLDVQSTALDGFDSSDVAALSILAEQIGSALVKARVLAAEQKRAAHLARVSEVAADATASPQPEMILKRLVELVQLRFEYHHVCYSAYDAARQEMQLVAVSGKNAALYRIGERWDAAAGLIGLAARSGQSVVSGNVKRDGRYLPDRDVVSGANSELCVPLHTANGVLGVLDVESLAYDAFDGNDIGAMEALANHVAVALERAYSLQQEQRRSAQLALVNQIASRIARLVPVRDLLDEAVDLIKSQFGYFNVAVFENEPDGLGTCLVANAGALDPWFGNETVILRHGIVFYVATAGVTYLCRDTRADTQYHSPFPADVPDPVKSEIAIPLHRGLNVIGVLDIQSERRDEFVETDVTILEILADQLATAIENARLFESEARRAAQLDAVRVLALKITAERDLDALLHSILYSAVDLVNADAAALDLVDRERNSLLVYISHNLPRDYTGHRMQFGEGLAGAAVVSGETIIVDDYAVWEGHVDWFPTDEFAGMMAIPLKWQAEVLGVIVLHRRRGRARFTEQELHLAGLFAAQAAIAIENADLLDAVQARLRVQRALTETSVKFLALTEPQAILDQVTHSALVTLDCAAAVLLLAEPDGKLAVSSRAGQVPEGWESGRLPSVFQNVLSEAFTTQSPAFWRGEGNNGLSSSAPASGMNEFQSGIVVPMHSGERAVGVIAVVRRSGRSFDMTDAQTLALLANQTASALERVYAFQQEHARVKELNLLFEGFRATASTLEPDEVIRRLLEQLVMGLDVTSSSFVRIDLAQRVLIQTHVYFADAASPSERKVDGRIWNLERLPEWEHLMAQSFVALQADDPDLTDETRAYMQANQLCTLLRVPLLSGGQVIGYISLCESRAPRHWTRNETLFVQTMASQAVVALVNAELYQAAQTRTRELHALYEAGRVLNQSLDLRTICENSVDALCDILGYRHVSIYFVVGQFLELQVERGYAEPDVLYQIPLTQGIMARAVRTRETILVPDISSEPDVLVALQDIQSEIAVPLLAGDRVLGVLNVETARSENWDARQRGLTGADVRLLNTFGNQLVVAIENARLFHETQQHLKHVRTLHAATQALNSELEWDAVLGHVAWQFLGALEVDVCTLFEWNRQRDRLEILAQRDTAAQRVRPGALEFPTHAWFAQAVLAEDRTIGLESNDAINDEVTREYLTGLAWQAVLLVPLMSKGQVVGLVELGDRIRPRSFTAEEMALAKSLALQAAIAIENAKLYRAAQQRLHETETLYRYTRELGGTLDIETLGTRALEAVARLTDFDFGEVCLVRESDNALVPLVFRGSAVRPHESHIVPAGVGILGWVAEHGRTVRLDDVTRDPRYVAFSEHIMSEICLPLRAGVRTIGVLNLEAKAPNAFDAHAEQLLTVFAQQLAIAVENARLYAQTKRDAELKAVLLRELSHRVKNNLAAITSLLYMALDEPGEMRAQILSETLGRVQSMSTAHALLSRATDGFVDLLDVGAQVLQDTVRNIAPPRAEIQIETDGDHVQVAMHQLTTLALVLNELATNALRHGWNPEGATSLHLRFVVARLSEQIAFLLQDDGKGLPEDFDLNARAGLGLSLVQSLVEKDLRGTFSIARHGRWTNAEVKFRIQEENP
jgi:GAF domain-containing protein